MAIDIEQSVRAFMQAAEQLGDKGKYAFDLRLALIDEEHDELVEAINHGDKVHIAKELVDLVYVVVGTAISMGIPFNEVFGAVHIANMSKFDGEAEVRPDGKILKGKNYQPAEAAIREILG